MIPAIVALFLYSLLPILRNTFTGIQGVDASLIEAGVGMGMTNLQLLFMVELPLALPVIMAGIRTAAVTIIGVATLASLIGAGGLGDLIFGGISMANSHMIFAGAIPAALLAVISDMLLGRMGNRLLFPDIAILAEGNSSTLMPSMVIPPSYIVAFNPISLTFLRGQYD